MAHPAQTMRDRKQRIGCIVPSINVTIEDDLRALCPAGVGIHFARADVDQTRPVDEQLKQMVDAAPGLAVMLAKTGVSMVAFACTSASFLNGAKGNRALTAAIADMSGIPTVTTATAVVDALEAVGAPRIGLATPYLQWVYEREVEFLAEHDVEVIAANGLDRRGGQDISGIDLDTIRTLVAEVNNDATDAILVSCTDLPVLLLIDELEAKFGKPVITSNQATYWACARYLGLAPMTGYGRLLREQL